MLKSDEGEITFNNSPLKVQSPSEARKNKIGMVFQHFSLFDSLTVRENLILGIDQNMSFSNLQEKVNEIPLSLQKYDLSIGSNKTSLNYTYNVQAKQTGITNLLQDLKDAGLKLKDLKTEQSTLEKIFVSLVREKNENKS